MIQYIALLLLLLIPATSHALDKKLGATNCFKVGIFDTIGNGIVGLDVVTPFAHTITKIQCGGNSATTMDETSDTMADEGSGYYYICSNDAITNNPEEECLGWVEGEGTMLNLIAKSPVKFKAVGATMSDVANLDWPVYNIVDLTNESGDQNPTTTSSDTDLTQSLNFTNTSPQPIMYFPTTAEDSGQNVNCNVQSIRTTITNYNTTTKVITYSTLPAAPDYRCVFRMY